MIKKYKFLFLLLFGLFVFIPKDTYAASLTLYNSNYGVVKSCTNCTALNGVTDSSSGFRNVARIRFGLDNLGIEKNHKYLTELATDIRLGGSSSVSPQLKNCIMYVGGWDVSGDAESQTLKRTSYANRVASFEFQNIRTFMSNQTTGYLECETNFQNEIVEVVYYTRSIQDLGDMSTDDIQQGLTNQTNTLLNNQNTNTDKIVESQDKINDSIKDNDVSGANDEASGFFNDFESDDFGLSDVITMPLSFIQGLSSSTCYSLNLPLPFVDTNVTLPCMTSIYQSYFGDFFTLYQIITTGFISYGICINIFRLVQGFKNPDNDEVEVMEL